MGQVYAQGRPDNMQISIKKCSSDDVREIQELGRQTYFETFQGTTSPENMNAYLEKAFDRKQLENELANPSSQFFLLHVNGEAAA
jgi:diamine N-acetyltransferase